MPTTRCPKCGSLCSHNAEVVRGTCPRCRTVFQVGAAAGEPAANARVVVPCRACGAANDEQNARCAACGAPLYAAVAPGEDPNALFNTLIPYRNVPALVGYYLAVFSLIPFLGIALGLAGFVLGIIGLRYAQVHPEARGKAHALVGIILGGLCGFGYLALLILAIAAARR